MKERYLQYEKAGDQYLGRVVSGLDVNDDSFAISPPYFESSGPKDKIRKQVNILLRDFTVGGAISWVKYFLCCITVLHHFVLILITWVGFYQNKVNCRHLPFSQTY